METRTAEAETMGRVVTEATIENLKDLWAAQEGRIRADQVRRITLPDALVDTGATLLSLPKKLIRELGLEKVGSRQVIASNGETETALYRAVQLIVPLGGSRGGNTSAIGSADELIIQGRSCTMDVLEVPDNVPVLIGQIPLEHLDFVVDLRNRTLIGNPAHGGEHMYELF